MTKRIAEIDVEAFKLAVWGLPASKAAAIYDAVRFEEFESEASEFGKDRILVPQSIPEVQSSGSKYQDSA